MKKGQDKVDLLAGVIPFWESDWCTGEQEFQALWEEEAPFS